MFQSCVGNAKKEDDWTASFVHPISKTHNEIIQSLQCPTCSNEFPTKNLIVKSGSRFSNLRCSRCSEISLSKNWKCCCQKPWVKCHIHCIPPKAARDRTEMKNGREMSRDVGVDHPLPKRTAVHSENQHVQLAAEPRRPIGLDPGSKLAGKFPHHVKGYLPTKGEVTGGGN